MGMLEARAGQAEVIEPVIERRARDGDAQARHIGEIRKPKPAWRMRLREDHIPLPARARHPVQRHHPALARQVSIRRRFFDGTAQKNCDQAEGGLP